MQSVVAVLAWCSSVVVSVPQPLMSDHHHPLQGFKLSKDEIFNTTSVLGEDIEMSTVVSTGNTSSYVYLHGAYGPLTLVIRPCSYSIHVSVYHVHQNSTGLLKDSIQRKSDSSLAMAKGMKDHVFSWLDASAGLYLLELVAEHRQTTVTLYGTSLPSKPAALRIKQQPKVWIQQRLHRNRVTVRWGQSTVDPHMMHYCVVVNSRRNFSRLCEAKSCSDMNVYVTNVKRQRLENKIHKKASFESSKSNKNPRTLDQKMGVDDIFITCVGSSLSYTISDLQAGREYYFNIFANNKQTQLSFLYASTALKYDPRLRPVGLRDNKPATVNIRRLGGQALFRYKVSALHGNVSALRWHVMPCGGAVQAEVSLRRQVVIPRQTVEGYRTLQVSHPLPGQRYQLLLYVNSEQMRQILAVEVLATTRTSVLPKLPAEAAVYEYSSMRTCDSVTVGWEPVPTQSVRYCVSASPVSLTETEDSFRSRPNQCGLDHRLRSRLDFVVKYCQDFSANDNRNVLVQTITKLRSGTEYLIQVTVKKTKGLALSYDLLRVWTWTGCKGLH